MQKRNIRQIVVHAVRRSESPAQFSKNFHYVISALGGGYAHHYANKVVTNTPRIDAEAYHIKYVIDDDLLASGQQYGNVQQQETLYGLLLKLVHDHDQARVVNASEMGIERGTACGFDIKKWMRNYTPLILADMNDEPMFKSEVVDKEELEMAGLHVISHRQTTCSLAA